MTEYEQVAQRIVASCTKSVATERGWGSDLTLCDLPKMEREIAAALYVERVRIQQVVMGADLHNSDCLLRTHNGACDCPQGETIRSIVRLIREST